MSESVVWITGASSGIGRALALRLARDGAVVAASARRLEELERLAAEALGGAGRIVPFAIDVTDRAATIETVDRIEQQLGPIEVAVLAAGTHRPVTARRFDARDLARLVEVNLLGTANALEPVMRAMIARRRGRIAVVSSVAGYRGLPTAAYYGATKAALINLAECLKFDLDRLGVHLQLIDPGFVETPLTDRNDFAMPFLMDPDEAARRIAKGLGSRRFEVTFPKRFTWWLKLLRCLPYALYFPIMARTTRR